MTYKRLNKDDAVVLLVDHQTGLISLVQDFSPNEFKNNVLALADVAKFFNLPTILAGGGFKHGQHLAFDTQRNYPLPNLYVSMLQRMGIESDTATGWPVTDWFEDLVMRYGGADEYKKWVKNETKFDSPVVKEAAAEFEKLMFTEGNVLGGQQAITATPFTEAAKPMFDEGEPGCWLLKQGSFFVGPDFLPEDVFANLDDELGVMGFPPAEAGGENPVLGGGDLAVLMSESEDAKTAMNLLATADIGKDAAPVSSFISPFKDFDASLYPSETTRTIANVAYDSTAFLFDGSDSMPAEVGAGSFWKEMTAWITGQDTEETLGNIESSWK